MIRSYTFSLRTRARASYAATHALAIGWRIASIRHLPHADVTVMLDTGARPLFVSPQSKYVACQRGRVSSCSCLSSFQRTDSISVTVTPALIPAALRCVTDCSVSP